MTFHILLNTKIYVITHSYIIVVFTEVDSHSMLKKVFHISTKRHKIPVNDWLRCTGYITKYHLHNKTWLVEHIRLILLTGVWELWYANYETHIIHTSLNTFYLANDVLIILLASHRNRNCNVPIHQISNLISSESIPMKWTLITWL